MSVGAYENPDGNQRLRAWLSDDEEAEAGAATGTNLHNMVAHLHRMVGQLRGRSYPSLTIDSEVLPGEFHLQPVRSTCRDRSGTSLMYRAEQLQHGGRLHRQVSVLPCALQITGTIDIKRF